MAQLKPMLARTAAPFSDADWIFEIKWDGTRALFFIDTAVQIVNRRNVDITSRYPEFQEVKENTKASSCVLDGEIVILKKGKPSFHDLQRREHIDNSFKIALLSREIPAVYIVFDILNLNGEDTTTMPLMERKSLLKEVISESPHVMISPHVEKKGEQYYKAATERGFEGIMAKRKDSLYFPGHRSEYWLKIKKVKTLDCVIGGFTEGEGDRNKYFGALLLGVNSPLEFVGKVGTGFAEEDLETILVMLKKIETGANPFTEPITDRPHFVAPVHVCEVKYLELTDDKKLRAPVFVRLRPDKSPEECTLNI